MSAFWTLENVANTVCIACNESGMTHDYIVDEKYNLLGPGDFCLVDAKGGQ